MWRSQMTLFADPPLVLNSAFDSVLGIVSKCPKLHVKEETAVMVLDL